MIKQTTIGNKMYVPVKGGVWIYDYTERESPCGFWIIMFSRRFIANSWYVDIDTDEL